MKQEFKRSRVIYQDAVIKLHQFSMSRSSELYRTPPVLVIPPHAGRHGNITQNLIDALVAKGKTVYALELLPATHATGGTSYLDLVTKIYQCVIIISPYKIDLVGVCQGGTLSAVYTALHQDRVNKLALFCAPINTKTGEDNSIEEYCKTMSMAYHKLIVSMYGGVQPGMLQWSAFALANPMPIFYQRYVDLAWMILKDDKPAQEKWKKNNGWYDFSIDLHGTWFLEVLEHHFMNNDLYNDTWDLGGGVIPHLKDITCPLRLYVGADDDITHPRQLLDMTDKVSSVDIRTTTIPKEGHTGPFTKPEGINLFISEFC